MLNLQNLEANLQILLILFFIICAFIIGSHFSFNAIKTLTFREFYNILTQFRKMFLEQLFVTLNKYVLHKKHIFI